MPTHNPNIIGRAIQKRNDYLGSTETGKLVLKALEAGHPQFYVEYFEYRFDDEHRSDFEQLLVPPYVDCLKEAVSQITPDLKLKCSRDEAVFEHTAEGITLRLSSGDFRDI
jgi:hypothetical protein